MLRCATRGSDALRPACCNVQHAAVHVEYTLQHEVAHIAATHAPGVSCKTTGGCRRPRVRLCCVPPDMLSVACDVACCLLRATWHVVCCARHAVAIRPAHCESTRHSTFGERSAPRCNAVQHTATRYNMLQRSTTCCNAVHHAAGRASAGAVEVFECRVEVQSRCSGRR